jgi:hypothetical protein
MANRKDFNRAMTDQIGGLLQPRAELLQRVPEYARPGAQELQRFRVLGGFLLVL